tara:strand:- start:2622 stop:2858 length:237 start_codon:yes stop_codon:yes gene_type:complete
MSNRPESNEELSTICMWDGIGIIKTTICCKSWGCEPRLIEGKTYRLVKNFFSNGEDQSIIEDESGKFTIPSIFLEGAI